MRVTATPTVLRAGEIVNVVPNEAMALVDVRLLPDQPGVLDDLTQVLGAELDIEVLDWDEPLEPSVDSPAFEAMAAAVRSEDPNAIAVPFLVSGGTDAKAFATLGITGHGFTPMWLPEGFDLLSQFHADDEHLPLTALETGARALERFLLTY